MQKNQFHTIVVGSGPSAAMAAQTLIEGGFTVAMIDVGEKDNVYAKSTPDLAFEYLRKTDENQHHYFLGKTFESIPWNEVRVGAQLSPARKAMIRKADKFLPLRSSNFSPMESLGYGGLGAGWGLGAYVYSKSELEKAGFNTDEMDSAYQVVADRIGISCGNDDVSPFLVGNLQNLQPPLEMDASVKKMDVNYLRQRNSFRSKNIYFGHPSMALLTKDYGSKYPQRQGKACTYNDMDFYSDEQKSAYRAQFTVDELSKNSNFTYINQHLVLLFKEVEDLVVLTSLNTETLEIQTFYCSKLILTAGAIGSARIVLRSFPELKELPILCNPYTYMPCIQPSMLGKSLGNKKHSMAQAMLIYDKNGTNDNLSSVAIYTYRSLLLYKLIKEAPLNFADGRGLFQYLQTSFIIAGIHHPDSYSENKKIALIKDDKSITNDILTIDFQLNETEKSEIKGNEKCIKAALRKMGVFPIKRLDPGFGGSIHYAGTIPFSNEERLGTTGEDGRLHHTKSVYVADASSFKYLPAKGITLSLMANAHRVAKKIIEAND